MVSFGSHMCIPHESMFIACHKSADEIEKLYCECFLSDCLKCEDYYYTICPLRCHAIKSHTGSDLMNKEATILGILFCHNKHTVNYASNLIKNHTLIAQILSE